MSSSSFGPLYVIDEPAFLLGSIVGAALAVVLRGAVQARLAALLGDHGVARARGGRGKGLAQYAIRHHVEPYGVVAWVITGWGWGLAHPIGFRASRRARLLPALAGPVLLALLTAAWVFLARAMPSSWLGDLAEYAAYTSAGMAVLSAVPVPPLDGWSILRALARPGPGLERARWHLEERNLGVVIALGLVLLPRLFQSLPDPVSSLSLRLVQVFGG